MPTSLDYTYTITRDNIINRASRIIGAIGQGETATATAITEAAVALNDLCKEWEADGMPLWALTTYELTPEPGVITYTIPSHNCNVQVAPLKILQVWNHNSSNNTDSPIILITRQEYNILGNKVSPGTPSQLWYDPPGNAGSGLPTGICSLFPVPDTNYLLYGTVRFTGHKPFQNFNVSTDVPDFPPYFYNALVWGLADQLSYEYGVGLSERSMISKKAATHKELALSFGVEEGSFRTHPLPSWDWETY